MTPQELSDLLETAWDGFLYQVRQGRFDTVAAEELEHALANFSFPEETLSIDRRLVSLLWYLPQFLSWQSERIQETGDSSLAFVQFANRIQGHVEQILGIP